MTRGRRVLLPVVVALHLAASGATAQSVADRGPNVEGPWSTEVGQLRFHFVHRFQRSDPPASKVFSSPTFLVATGLATGVDVGLRYATSSLLVQGEPNEVEAFARWLPVEQSRGGPLDVAMQLSYSRTARSLDGELAVAYRSGPVRTIAVGRAFESFAGAGTEWALGAALVARITSRLAVAADVSSLIGDDAAEAAWGVGLQIDVPYTPHSLSLHYTTANTATLQGASIGTEGRWGFEFTIPITVSRYFGRRSR